MIKQRMLVPLGFMVLSAILAPNVSADEKTWYPGVSCKYYGKQASDSFFDPNGFAANGLKNTSGSARYAVCPMVSQNLRVFSAAITISSSSPDVCKLYAKDNVDGSQEVYDTFTVREEASGAFEHSFLVSSGAVHNRQTLTFYCEVPAGGVIRSYELVERI